MSLRAAALNGSWLPSGAAGISGDAAPISVVRFFAMPRG